MFGNLHFGEIVIIMIIALLIFGPKKLPEMGKAIGSAVTEFKKGLSGVAATTEEKKNEAPRISEPSETSKNDGPYNPAG